MSATSQESGGIDYFDMYIYYIQPFVRKVPSLFLFLLQHKHTNTTPSWCNNVTIFHREDETGVTSLPLTSLRSHSQYRSQCQKKKGFYTKRIRNIYSQQPCCSGSRI